MENEKLAREVMHLTNQLDVMKIKYESENKQIKKEVCKLNAKVENYKNLCASENKAKEHLQSFVIKAKCEIEELTKTLKAKEGETSDMKKDYESFMEQICDENKILKEGLDLCEKETSRLKSIKEQSDGQKNYIADLEGETKELIKKIKYLQESNRKYEDANSELKGEVKSLEKKIIKICESRNFTSEALDTMTAENKELREALEQVRTNLSKAEECNKEYVTEIEKFDRLTGTMEEQLGKYKSDIEKLEDCLTKEKELNKEMVEDFKQMETMATALEEEQTQRKAVESDLIMVAQAHRICEKRLRCAIHELEILTASFESYKKNIQNLKVQIQSRASRSCPPPEHRASQEQEDDEHNQQDGSFRDKTPMTIVSCQLLFKNSRKLSSLPSLLQTGAAVTPRYGNRNRTPMSRWKWPVLCKKNKERKRVPMKHSNCKK